MKTITRVTKKLLREELGTLSAKVQAYHSMDHVQLFAEYRSHFPIDTDSSMSREEIIRILVQSGIHYIENVFDL